MRSELDSCFLAVFLLFLKDISSFILFLWFYCYLHQQRVLSPLLCLAPLIVFFPVPEPLLETTVNEDVNSMVLLNLLPGTEYNVQLTASYPIGESEPLLKTAKTCRCHYMTLMLLLYKTFTDCVFSLWGKSISV